MLDNNRRGWRQARRWADKSGQTLLILAIAFASMLALLGLIFDGGRLYFEKRRMQAAADAGAFAAVHELRRNFNQVAQVKAGARRDVNLNGFDAQNSTIRVEYPVTVGGVANNQRVAVEIDQTVATTFMRVVGRGPSTVKVRAVAEMDWDANVCVSALEEGNKANTLTVSGGATLETDCGIWVNGSDSRAMGAPGGSQGSVQAPWAGIVGGYSAGNYGTTQMKTGMGVLTDPLILVQEPQPNYGGLTNQNANGTDIAGVTHYYPGIYNAEIKSTGGDIFFHPGLYVIEGGLKITGGNAQGAAVTFYVVNPTGNKNVEILTTGTVQFSAPTAADIVGPQSGVQGILFFGSRSNTYKNNGHKLGRSTVDSYFEGATYFPAEDVNWAGSAATTNNNSMLFAQTIKITGSVKSVFNAPTNFNSGPLVYRAALIE